MTQSDGVGFSLRLMLMSQSDRAECVQAQVDDPIRPCRVS
jgi:hypothetical protein